MSLQTFIGHYKSGQEWIDPSCPTLVAKAQALAKARVPKTDPLKALIISESWPGGHRGNQFFVEFPPSVAARMRSVYGFTASCTCEKSSGTPTPFLLNVVLEVPFRFSEGRSSSDDRWEFAGGRVYVRALAFITLYCDRKPWISFRHGEPAYGILESKHNPQKPEPHPSSMLVGWHFSTFGESLVRTFAYKSSHLRFTGGDIETRTLTFLEKILGKASRALE